MFRTLSTLIRVPFKTRSPLMLIHRNFMHFSQKKDIEEIRCKLIDDAHKMNPSTIIKLTHILQFKQNQNKNLSNQECEHIFGKITSEIFRLSHQDLTLFLEIIRQIPSHSKYSRENLLHRQISQRIFTVQTMKIQNKYIFRLLHALLQMDFPHLLISKYIHVIVSQQKKIMIGKQPLPSTDCLRIAITVLELNYIPIQNLIQFYENVIEKHNFNQPKDLCLLHYFLTQVREGLKQKIKYFQKKGKIHDMLFNPFSTLNTPQQQQGAQNAQEENVSRLSAESQQFLQKLKNKSNIQKLEEQIVKVYDYEQFHITPATATYLAKIKGMEARLGEYCQLNYNILSPLEFIIVSKSIPLQTRTVIFGKYCTEMWQFLDISQKCNILRHGAMYCGKQKVNKQDIFDILQKSKEISSQELISVGSLIQDFLSENEQGQVIKMMDQIVQKM